GLCAPSNRSGSTTWVASLVRSARFLCSADKHKPLRRLVQARSIDYTAPMTIRPLAKGDHVMNPTVAYRVSPWILVALIATLLLLAVAAVALSQSGMLHALGAALQGSPLFAGPCGVSIGPC